MGVPKLLLVVYGRIFLIIIFFNQVQIERCFREPSYQALVVQRAPSEAGVQHWKFCAGGRMQSRVKDRVRGRVWRIRSRAR